MGGKWKPGQKARGWKPSKFKGYDHLRQERPRKAGPLTPIFIRQPVAAPDEEVWLLDDGTGTGETTPSLT